MGGPQVEVTTPEEHMGDVIGDLNSRRGMVGEFIDKPGNLRLIKARPASDSEILKGRWTRVFAAEGAPLLSPGALKGTHFDILIYL